MNRYQWSELCIRAYEGKSSVLADHDDGRRECERSALAMEAVKRL